MQAIESIASDLAYALDPALFASGAGISLDPWQADVVRSNDSQILLNCHRQGGKSTTTGVLAVHTAIYDPGVILVLSPSLRQSRELFRKCLDVYENVGPLVPSEVENKLELELTNGARIVSLPGTEATIRGFSNIKLLIVDEASRVSDDLYYAIRPMLAISRGRIVLLSTPFGKRGFFHKEWSEGGPDWKRVKVTAYECPRISREWLEAERDRIGDWWFKQEYLCEFVESIDSVFSFEDIQRAFSDETVTPLFG